MAKRQSYSENKVKSFAYRRRASNLPPLPVNHRQAALTQSFSGMNKFYSELCNNHKSKANRSHQQFKREASAFATVLPTGGRPCGRLRDHHPRGGSTPPLHARSPPSRRAGRARGLSGRDDQSLGPHDLRVRAGERDQSDEI